MIFDWDDRKEEDNIRKHGVDFWEAQTVFNDPLAKQFADTYPTEARCILIGLSARRRLLLVAFTEKAGKTIRIISARRPTPKEKRDYEEGI